MSLIQSVETNQNIDSATEDVVIRLSNGRVIHISPEFNAINVWEPGAFDAPERDYYEESRIQTLAVDMGGDA